MVQLGIDVLLSQRRELLRGKRVGLVSNYTVTDKKFIPVIDHLKDDPEWHLTRLFGPEHGMRNSAREGEHVSSEVDEHTGLLAYSLYGDTKKPSKEMLADLDVLVIDLHDIGTRYYTNMNTMAYCMDACAEAQLPCIVLDRPNPLGGTVLEGNILDESFSSFVGMFAIANRHGLTMGELAMMHHHRTGQKTDLTVVAMNGWHRDALLPETGVPFVPSSPNTTCFDMAVLYPGMCLFEGANVSLGRGTTHPFEVVGTPFFDGHSLAREFNALNLSGVRARPVYFVPNYSQYKGELCSGIQVHVTEARQVQPVRLGVSLMQLIFNLYPEKVEFLGVGGPRHPFLDLLAGTDKLRHYVTQGRGEDYLLESATALEEHRSDIRDMWLYSV